MQALYAQRNIVGNAQRKYVVSYTVVKQATHKDGDEDGDEFGGRPRGKGRRRSESLTIVPSNPVELKDVLLYAPSPSGRIFECSFHKLQHMLEENARLSLVALLLPAPAAASLRAGSGTRFATHMTSAMQNLQARRCWWSGLARRQHQLCWRSGTAQGWLLSCKCLPSCMATSSMMDGSPTEHHGTLQKAASPMLRRCGFMAS